MPPTSTTWFLSKPLCSSERTKEPSRMPSPQPGHHTWGNFLVVAKPVIDHAAVHHRHQATSFRRCKISSGVIMLPSILLCR